jgi:large repetitive protein
VAVRDTLPVGVTFVSAVDAAPGSGAFTCTQASGVIDCIGATIAGTVPGPGGMRTIIITVTAPNKVGGLVTQAVADPNNLIPEGDETNNAATFATSVDSQINLSVTKTGPPSSDQSQTSEFDITVKNENTPPSGGSGQTAFGVVMHDPLPVGLIPLSVQFEYNNPGTGNWACQIQGDPINLVDCLGDLNAGQSVTIKVSVFMTAESGKPLDNQACVDPDHLIEQYSPPGRSDDCSTHTTITGGTNRSPNLFVTKNGDPTQVTGGDTLTYTIGVQNNGDADAFSPVTITDVLPTSVTFVNANATNGWTCSGTTTVTCHDDGTGLAVGASSTITIHTTVNDGVTTPIVNTASAAPATHNPAETDAEDETFAHQGDNSATAKSSTGGSAFDLVLSSITDNPDPVIPGQGLKYKIIAVNGGTQAAPGVHMSVALPSVTSATFLSADGSNGFNCSGPVANVLDCVGDLPAGGDTTVTVSEIVLVQPIPAPDLVLSATIDSTHAYAETDEGNNTKTETTTISGLTCSNCIDLVAAQLVASTEPLASGGNETFTFQVVNVGDTGTTLDPTDPLQPLIKFEYASGTSLTPGTPVASNLAITCSITTSTANHATVLCFGNLGAGQGVTITIPITNVVGDLFAVGTADPNGKVAESNEGNNQLKQSVVVQ